MVPSYSRDRGNVPLIVRFMEKNGWRNALAIYLSSHRPSPGSCVLTAWPKPTDTRGKKRVHLGHMAKLLSGMTWIAPGLQLFLNGSSALLTSDLSAARWLDISHQHQFDTLMATIESARDREQTLPGSTENGYDT